MKLSAVAEFIMGQAPNSNTYNDNGEGSLLIMAGDFQELYPKPTQYTTNPISFSQNGDVLICVVGATSGKVNLGINASITRSVAAIRPNKSKLHDKFLFYFLKANYKRLNKLSSGSAQGIISKPVLASIEIPNFSLVKQIKIATILSNVETLIKQRKENIDLLDEYLKSTFFKMFGDPVRNEKNWDANSLGDITNKITDGEHLTPKLTKSGFHLIMAKDVLDDKVDFKQNNFVSEQDFLKFTKKCNPENGDVLLVSRGATIGRCVVVKVDRPFCLMGSVILIKPNVKKLNGTFINYLFKNNSFKRRLILTSGFSAQQAIYLVGLKKTKIIVPPIDLQNQFSSIVEKAEVLKEQLINSLIDLENLYSSLSQRAFKDKLDLTKLIVNYEIEGRKEETKNQIDEDPFEVDEETAKKQGKLFYKQWQKLHLVKPHNFYNNREAVINWEWLANRIKERYSDKHFNFEMLMNYVKKEKLIDSVNYYSSEELKANPTLNDDEDVKAFIHSAISNVLMDEEQQRKSNKFITIKQLFYNAEKENFQLNLHKDDFKLLKDKNAKQRSGIYFSVIKEQ